MRFDQPRDVESVCWQMREADYPRSTNRQRIDELFNGFPPYTDEEVEANGIEVNVNFLESTTLAHDARSQFNNAFMKPGQFFTSRTDMGPQHKRGEHGSIFTRGINRIMKRSLSYFECFRSQFALTVLHGISPSPWADQDCWEPQAASVGDIFLPSGTLLTMKNLPLFCIPRSFTAPELIKLTRRAELDKGWKMDNVNSCLEWIDRESQALLGSNWPEIWAPEKMGERIKGDGGYYYGDKCPTIDVFDFYFYDDDGKDPGWRRRMVLDAWSTPEGNTKSASRKKGDIYKSATLLYSSENRKVADKRENIVAFQFADLSSVAPFYYHSVRSLGFLLYAVCHIQNRMRCKFIESVFEALQMYFRVKSIDDAQRALKLDLINRGFIDETLTPLTASERYQVNAGLVELGLKENSSIIQKNSSSYTQNTDYSQQGVEKTKFQVLAETNAMTSLVSAGLTQAYMYKKFEYDEIVRRFCKPQSTDPEVREAQAWMLARGLPKKMLVANYWENEPERVMGAGNKTLEMTIANQLMEWRDKYDPEPQRKILRDATLAITDDPGRAEELVPEKPMRVTDSVHDAQLAAGVLMQGLPVAIKTGMNHIEYVETLMVSMAITIDKIKKMQNGVGRPDQLLGLQSTAAHIAKHIQIIAQDDQEQARANDFSKKLGKLMNEVKAMGQRFAQMQKAQAANGQNGNGEAAKDKAKLQATIMQAKAKMQNTRESHAQRTAQRQIQFEQQIKQDAERHTLELQKESEKIRLETMGTLAKTAADIKTNRLKSANRSKDE